MALGSRIRDAFGFPKVTLGDNSQVLAVTDIYSDGLIREHFREVSGLTAGALNADLVVATDVRHFQAFNLQVNGAFVGTLTLQGSNDNSNWFSVSAQSVGALNTAPINTITANGIYFGPINFRFFRVRMTAYTSGTATGVLELDADSPANLSQTPTTGLTAAITGTSSNGNSINTGNAAATTNATSVKGSAGTLYSVVINNASAAAKFFKIYNKAAAPTVGTDIPVITITVPANSSFVQNFTEGILFSTGIAFATTGAVADTDVTALAAGDLKWLIQYR